MQKEEQDPGVGRCWAGLWQMLDLSKEVGKGGTVRCLPNWTDCWNSLGSLLKIKIPRPHPKLTRSESSRRGWESPFLMNAPGDSDDEANLADAGAVIAGLCIAQRQEQAGVTFTYAM